MTDSKRSKITPEHQQESARLKALWDDGRPHRTQAVFGEVYGLGNQANVGHYLNGRSPLNPKAAAAFAVELGCSVSDFSLRVAEELARLAEPTRPASAPASTPAPGEPTLGQALEVVVAAISALPQPARKALAEDLALLAVAPGDAETRQRVANALQTGPSIAERLLAIPSQLESPRFPQRATEK